jgi:hypothetical protein
MIYLTKMIWNKWRIKLAQLSAQNTQKTWETLRKVIRCETIINGGAKRGQLSKNTEGSGQIQREPK